jgi:hypothetical protein
MESSRDEAAAQLAAADRVRESFASDLRLPAGFHALLGVATATLTASIAFNAGSGASRTAAVTGIVGIVVFLATASYLVWRFRAINGAQVDGLLARAIFGSTWEASTAFCLPLALATWAAIADRAWLAGLLCIVGGIAYAACAQRWWVAYRRDPVARTERESTLVLTLVLVGLAVAGIVLVAVSSR